MIITQSVQNTKLPNFFAKFPYTFYLIFTESLILLSVEFFLSSNMNNEFSRKTSIPMFGSFDFNFGCRRQEIKPCRLLLSLQFLCSCEEDSCFVAIDKSFMICGRSRMEKVFVIYYISLVELLIKTLPVNLFSECYLLRLSN